MNADRELDSSLDLNHIAFGAEVENPMIPSWPQGARFEAMGRPCDVGVGSWAGAVVADELERVGRRAGWRRPG